MENIASTDTPAPSTSPVLVSYYTVIYERAKKLAAIGHAGDVRKPNNNPYTDHTTAVANRAMSVAMSAINHEGADPKDPMIPIFLSILGTVGHLHDLNEVHPEQYSFNTIYQYLVEDIDEVSDMEKVDIAIIHRYVLKIIDTLKVLTRRFNNPDATYMQYVEILSENPVAHLVKIADLEDNMKDLPEDDSLMDRYKKAHKFLVSLIYGEDNQSTNT